MLPDTVSFVSINVPEWLRNPWPVFPETVLCVIVNPDGGLTWL
jgi:hypothetical protein